MSDYALPLPRERKVVEAIRDYHVVGLPRHHEYRTRTRPRKGREATFYLEDIGAQVSVSQTQSFPVYRFATNGIEQGLLELESEVRNLTKLEDNWDGEGSAGYSVDVCERAVQFVKRHVEWMRKTLGRVPELPSIDPGPGSSIDVHWQTDKLELLVNIPKDPTEKATYYGDDYADFSFKGAFNPDEINRTIGCWIAFES